MQAASRLFLCGPVGVVEVPSHPWIRGMGNSGAADEPRGLGSEATSNNQTTQLQDNGLATPTANGKEKGRGVETRRDETREGLQCTRIFKAIFVSHV